MTTYNGFGAADPGGVGAFNDGLAITFGTVYQSTVTGTTTVKVRIWIPSGHESTDMATLDGRIYLLSDSSLQASQAFGTVVAGWNEVTISLATIQTAYYMAAVYSVGQGYPAKAAALATDIVNGPLTIPGAVTRPNGVYLYGNGCPTSNGSGTWFGVDVTIDVASSGGPTDAVDTIPVSDTLARGVLTATRGISDSITVSDSLARGAKTASRGLSDSITLSDSLGRGFTAVRGVSDAFSLSDALTHGTFVSPRNVSDVIAISDALARGALTAPRSISDAFGVSDVLSRLSQIHLSDSLVISDTLHMGPVTTLVPAKQTGSWWRLDSILKSAAELRTFYGTQEPIACPRCGQPLLNGPPQSSHLKYCPWGHFSYPRDWDKDTMSGM